MKERQASAAIWEFLEDPGDDESGTSSGSAYVFRFDGVQWVEEQKLLASDGAQGDSRKAIP